MRRSLVAVAGIAGRIPRRAHIVRRTNLELIFPADGCTLTPRDPMALSTGTGKEDHHAVLDQSAGPGW